MAEEDPDWPEAAGQGRPAAPAGEAMPRLSVAGFEGPLDFLLEMVRRHRVDLGPLSIVALTDRHRQLADLKLARLTGRQRDRR